MTIIYLLELKLFFPNINETITRKHIGPFETCDEAEKYGHNQGIEMKDQIFNFQEKYFSNMNPGEIVDFKYSAIIKERNLKNYSKKQKKIKEKEYLKPCYVTNNITFDEVFQLNCSYSIKNKLSHETHDICLEEPFSIPSNSALSVNVKFSGTFKKWDNNKKQYVDTNERISGIGNLFELEEVSPEN